jgi:hypothetical protein
LARGVLLFARFMPRVSALPLLALIALLLPGVAEAVSLPRTMTSTSARALPYAYVGQLYFTSGRSDYIGSGTVIRARSILTAGHNVYDPDGGWSTDVEFRRAAYGSTALTDVFATKLFLLGGYRAAVNTYGTDSLRSFAYDTAGAVYANPLAAGKFANLYPSLNNSYVRFAIGYGAEEHSGDNPLIVAPTTPFFPVYGQYWENRSLTFEGGMSGGPLFMRTPAGVHYVTGVVVASSGPPLAGGVRLLDATVKNFVLTNLP